MPIARVILWVASIGGLALLARSLIIGPVPLWLAATAMTAYATYATLGVLFPHLEMYGDVVWKLEPGQKVVALTFDDGPHPVTTRAILETLARGSHKATFFVVGHKVDRHPEVVREIVEAGHGVAIHGYEHERLYAFKPPTRVLADIRRCQEALERACGKRPVLFRPPIGHVSSRTAVGARRAGVSIVGWTVRGYDGSSQASAERVRARVLAGLADGAIILLHDTAERDEFEPASLAALPGIIEALDARGLRSERLEFLES